MDGISIVGLTPAGLLLLAVLMVFTGRLVPRSTHQDVKDERDKWRQAYEASEEARLVSDAQTRELLEVAKLSKHFWESIGEYSEQIKSGDS
jgi:hypothetical protein